MEQERLDAAIQEYYSGTFDEADRLAGRSVQGVLEFLRTQELIAEQVAPNSRIIDIGGATGIHAAPLAEQGHTVVLVDPVPAQVMRARHHGGFEAKVGDARRLDYPDDAFDAALLLGPLYHLRDAADRRQALAEAARVVRPGGVVLAAAIPRFIRYAVESLAEDVPHPYPAAWVDLLEHGHPTGRGPFPAGRSHTAEELEQELTDAGLTGVEVRAIEGVGGLPLEELRGEEPEVLEAALLLVRRTGTLPGIRDMTNHLMGIGRVAGRAESMRA